MTFQERTDALSDEFQSTFTVYPEGLINCLFSWDLPVVETRNELICRAALQTSYHPDSPEAWAYAQGFGDAEVLIRARVAAAEPIVGGPVEGSDEDKALANAYGLQMGKSEDERWSAYRDYLRGLQRGRES